MRWRVYIKPFNTSGAYQSSWTEITSDVVSLEAPKQAIDNTDYDVGVIRNSGFSITLRNDQGYYSDVDEIRSIFSYSRKNSQVKITWDVRDYDLICNFFSAGKEPLGGELAVFQGLLNEVSSVSDIQKQQATFTVFGYESLVDEMQTPYSSINNGDLLSVALYTMLNQAPFNTLVTVSQANIAPNTDVTIDDKTSLENTTVGDALANILLAGNAVLYIKNGIVYVTGRTASAATQKTFYGQASDQGIESALAILNFRDGMNRTLNFWTWTSGSESATDTSSVTKYGTLSKDMQADLITDATKIQSILNANRTEFAFPKTEFDIETPIWYDVLALNILDRIAIDYPTVHIPYNGGDLPRYGFVTYDGTARYPYDQWALTLDTSTTFKILSRVIDPKKNTITFGVREI